MPTTITQAGIDAFCAAVGCTNPIYIDPDWAATSAHGQIIAPAFMLNGLVMDALETRYGDGVHILEFNLEYKKYVHVGDAIDVTLDQYKADGRMRKTEITLKRGAAVIGMGIAIVRKEPA